MTSVMQDVVVPLCFLSCLLCSSVVASALEPADVEGWRSDVDFAVEAVEALHPLPWLRISEDEFKGLAQDLKCDIPGLSERQVAVRFMQLVARLGDGHTAILPSNRPEFAAWFPVRVDRFFDGIFVTAISKQHEGLLGAEVLRVGGMSAQEAFERVGSVTSVDGPYGWPRTVPQFFSSAAILRALGVIDADELPLEVRTLTGELREVKIPSESWRVDFGWALRGYSAPGGGEHVDVCSLIMKRDGSLPLHLRHITDRNYWFEFLPDDRTLYVQLNLVRHSPDEHFERFAERLWAFYEGHSGEIDRFVLDLRYNSGGNASVLPPLIRGIVRHGDIAKRGSLYAIIGPGTYSAASNCLGQMLEHTGVIVVGEPASGPLNWCSDTQDQQLPHSGLYMSVSTLCWQKGHPSDTRGHVPPHHLVPVLASDLFAGRDRALEAILDGEIRTLTDILRDEGGEAFMAEYERRTAVSEDVDWWFPYLESELGDLGHEMLSAERFDDATAVLSLATARYPESWRSWMNLGNGYSDEGDRKRAIQSYERSLELYPGNFPLQRRLWGTRFVSALDTGGVDEAIRVYRETREEDTRAYDENQVNSLGYFLMGEGRTREAIEVFRLNTEAFPESWNVWDSLGEAHMEDGDAERAIQCYERSLALNPDSESAREALRRLGSDD